MKKLNFSRRIIGPVNLLEAEAIANIGLILD
jgi:hypothetical protein